MGFVCLLYYEFKYVIIDEGISVVFSDVEGLLYEICKEKGISMYLLFKIIILYIWLIN